MKDWKAFDDINYLDLQKKLALTYLKLDPVQTSVKFNLREKMTNQLTGAEIVFKALEEHGVEYIFGYPGGAVLPMYDQISKQKK